MQTTLFLFWRRIFAVIALLALAYGYTGIAAETATAPVYLRPDVAVFQHLLPPPPADDSPAGQADLAVVLRLQAERTPEQVARTQHLAAHTPFQMGSVAWGPDFTPENLPETAMIFKAVRDQSRPVILAAKGAWARPRPYQRDPRVTPCVSKPASSSYPSGHSTESALWAAILAAAFPGKAACFEKEVEDTMWSRIVGGAHYPTDTQAGRMLGEEIARKMPETADLQIALEIIRTETSRLPGAKAVPSASGHQPAPAQGVGASVNAGL